MATEINRNMSIQDIIIDTQEGFYYTFPIKKQVLINNSPKYVENPVC